MLSQKKRLSVTFVSIGFLMLCAQAVAQFDSGSDSSDGNFVPGGVIEVDLSLAIDGSWNTPGTGTGVYDANVWAVVFKYGTINVQVGDVITFKNHPSGAPVVWLAQADVTIDGVVSVDGGVGHAVGAPLPRLSEPGPGGFEGGHCGFDGNPPLLSSGGFGLGGAGLVLNNGDGGGYATPGEGEFGPGGDIYGNESVSPLIGGSGGAAPIPGPFGGGGAGAGAILIASTGTITINGSITATGGSNGNFGGGGSGGAIRLIADTISGPGALRALGGVGAGSGGVGRTRVEAFTNNLTDLGDPQWTESTPGSVFPLPNAPTLKVASVNGVAAGTDPKGGILTTDLLFNKDTGVPVVIQTTGIPANAGTSVTVRITPYRGMEIVLTATNLAGNCTAGTITFNVPNYPRGRTELQVKASWNPLNSCP